jgi:hypothetical protein
VILDLIVPRSSLFVKELFVLIALHQVTGERIDLAFWSVAPVFRVSKRVSNVLSETKVAHGQHSGKMR